MNFREFCYNYFDKIKNNLPFNAYLHDIKIYGNKQNLYFPDIPEFGDKIVLYYTYGVNKDGLKRSSFTFIWGELQREQRNRKLDQLFD